MRKELSSILRNMAYRIAVADDPERVEMLLDIISENQSDPRSDPYKKELQELGIDWKTRIMDDVLIESASLNDVKELSDFRSFNKYKEYCKTIWHLRNIALSPGSNLTGGGGRGGHLISVEEATELGKKLGFKVEHREVSGGDLARAGFSTIRMPKSTNLYVLIHEIGHIYDEKNSYEGVAKSMSHSISTYGVMNAGETFAENFAYFFLQPELMKSKLPEVYTALNSAVDGVWKETINSLVF